MIQILTAKDTGHAPVCRVGEYLYCIGTGGPLISEPFDVREVAQYVPGFEAGETVQEHRSLLLMAFLQLRKLEGLLLGQATARR